jgi:hypothetical protein
MRGTTHLYMTGLVALSAALYSTPVLGQPERAPAPRRALSGTWVMTEFEEDGTAYPAVFVSDEITIDAKAGKFRRSHGAPFVGGYTDTGTFKVADEVEAGQRVELAFSRYGGFGEGPPRRTDETGRALWKVDDKGRLQVCYGARKDGKDGPESFTTKKGDGRLVVIYERERP